MRLKNIFIKTQNTVINDALINHNYKFMLFFNKKCGCGTAIEWFLFTMNELAEDVIKNREADKQFGMTVQDYVRKNKDRLCATKKDLIKRNDYVKIIIVRNPWRRVVSFYCDKILIKENHLRSINTKTKEAYSYNMTFRELLNYIDKIPDSDLEPHLRSQAYGRDEINFDYVVKLEEFNEGIEQVSNDLDIRSINVKVHRNRTKYDVVSNEYFFDKRPEEIISTPPYDLFYNDELRMLIAKKYKKDIERFKYLFAD